MLAVVAAALLFAVPAGARSKPTPSPAPTVAPSADPAVTKLIRQQFLAWQVGSIDKTLYDPQLVAQMTDAKIADTSKHIAPLGALTATDYVGPFSGEDFPEGAHGYIYQMTCSNAKIYVWMVVTAAGKIATMKFTDTLTTEDVSAPPDANAPTPGPPVHRKRLAH